MDALIVGGGKMGLAIAYDLLQHDATVTMVDANPECLAARLSNAVTLVQLNATDRQSMEREMHRHDVVVSALPYDFNYSLAETAISAGTHFCDLGGNTDMVKKELALHDAACEAGVALIPDCGLSPGLTNVIGAYLIEQTKARELHIRVGGLPLEPQPPLEYTLVFSVHGLINEYVGEARILQNGRIASVEPLSGLESIDFDGFPSLEAFYTAGGTSTLPDTYAGQVETLDDKSIRYQGHRDKIQLLRDLGFFEGEAQAVTEQVLQSALDGEVPDVILARLTAVGDTTEVIEIRDYFDSATGLSAMMRTTGFPTSITALMLASGDISLTGCHPPERCVPPELFMEALRDRDIRIETSMKY